MRKALSLFICLAFLVACGSKKSTVQTKKSNKKEVVSSKKKSGKAKMLKKKAVASYYHDKFNGRKTANGEKFSNSKLTAAHRTLDFGTEVRVTNLKNGKSVVVRINNRGPFKKSREIDISKKAFLEITHDKNAGLLDVSVEVLN